jgi:hypothetical protein
MTPGQSLDGRHAAAFDMGGRHETRVHRHAIDQHRARTTLAFPAALFRPRQPAVFAQQVEKTCHRMRGHPHALPVQGKSDRHSMLGFHLVIGSFGHRINHQISDQITR